MTSKDSSDRDEKETRRGSSTSSCWGKSCFSKASNSDYELDVDSEYVVINQNIFKVAKHSQMAPSDPMGSPECNRTVIVQRGSEEPPGQTRKSSYRKSYHERSGVSDRRERRLTKSELDSKIYQYIRMKTYERMNPYEMRPNDFLNNISSVFVENLKEPIPKDPLRRPRIFNRYIRRKKKSKAQLMYEKAKANEQPKQSEAHSLRKPTVNPAVMSDMNRTYGESSVSYKASIDQDGRGKGYEEKVLIWKILVVNNEDEENKD